MFFKKDSLMFFYAKMQLFDQKYSKNAMNIEKYYYNIKILYFTLFKYYFIIIIFY